MDLLSKFITDDARASSVTVEAREKARIFAARAPFHDARLRSRSDRRQVKQQDFAVAVGVDRKRLLVADRQTIAGGGFGAVN